MGSVTGVVVRPMIWGDNSIDSKTSFYSADFDTFSKKSYYLKSHYVEQKWNIKLGNNWIYCLAILFFASVNISNIQKCLVKYKAPWHLPHNLIKHLNYSGIYSFSKLCIKMSNSFASSNCSSNVLKHKPRVI